MLSEIKKANEREGEVLKTKKRVLLDEQGTETNVWAVEDVERVALERRGLFPKWIGISPCA